MPKLYPSPIARIDQCRGTKLLHTVVFLCSRVYHTNHQMADVNAEQFTLFRFNSSWQNLDDMEVFCSMYDTQLEPPFPNNKRLRKMIAITNFQWVPLPGQRLVNSGVPFGISKPPYTTTFQTESNQCVWAANKSFSF